MDRKGRIALLVDHVENPRHKGILEDADVAMPGGSPECGGSVVIHLKGEGDGRIGGLSFTGEGDTISMAATSMLMELVSERGLTMDEVLALDYDEFVGRVGREVVGSRTKNATLGLSTLKAAVKRYRRLSGPGIEDTSAARDNRKVGDDVGDPDPQQPAAR